VWIHEHGLTFRAISTAEEALDYLKGWRGVRPAIYDHALRAMEAAMLDEIDAKLARDIFRAFAASEGVLAEADVAREVHVAPFV
jgi:hypothetical protein